MNRLFFASILVFTYHVARECLHKACNEHDYYAGANTNCIRESTEVTAVGFCQKSDKRHRCRYAGNNAARGNFVVLFENFTDSDY